MKKYEVAWDFKDEKVTTMYSIREIEGEWELQSGVSNEFLKI